MSLLLNALKKAALEKQKREGPLPAFAPAHEPAAQHSRAEQGRGEAPPETEQDTGSPPATHPLHMEYDAEFLQLEESQPAAEAPPRAGKPDPLFIENDENSWDESLAGEFNLDDIDADLEFNADEIEDPTGSALTAVETTDNGPLGRDERRPALAAMSPTEAPPTAATPTAAPPTAATPTAAPERADHSTGAGDDSNATPQPDAETQHVVAEQMAAATDSTASSPPGEASAKQAEAHAALQPAVDARDAANKGRELPADAPPDEAAATESTGQTPPVTENQRAHIERRAALQQMLQQSEATAQHSARRRRLLLSLLALLTCGVTGGYYYLINRDSPAPPLALNTAPNSTQPAPLSTGPQRGASEQQLLSELATELAHLDAQAQTAGQAQTAEQTQTAGQTQTARQTQTAEQTQTARQAQTAERALASPRAPAKPAAKASAEAPTEQRLVLTENTSQHSVFSQHIAAGFQAWQRGQWSMAEAAYGAALSINPHHRDAMLGAAAVAAQLGQQQKALQLYQQRLERAPRDEFALAGIIGLGTLNSDNIRLESELNSLLLSFPQGAHLHYLKGALHAQRNQWQGAQNAFFEAWRLDASRPDYAFNLAVSLDHLDLQAQALEFYQRAASLATTKAANFSLNDLHSRIEQLQRQLAQGGF